MLQLSRGLLQCCRSAGCLSSLFHTFFSFDCKLGFSVRLWVVWRAGLVSDVMSLAECSRDVYGGPLSVRIISGKTWRQSFFFKACTVCFPERLWSFAQFYVFWMVIHGQQVMLVPPFVYVRSNRAPRTLRSFSCYHWLISPVWWVVLTFGTVLDRFFNLCWHARPIQGLSVFLLALHPLVSSMSWRMLGSMTSLHPFSITPSSMDITYCSVLAYSM